MQEFGEEIQFAHARSATRMRKLDFPPKITVLFAYRRQSKALYYLSHKKSGGKKQEIPLSLYGELIALWWLLDFKKL